MSAIVIDRRSVPTTGTCGNIGGWGLSDSRAELLRGFMEIFALFCSVWEFRLKLFAVVFGSETSTPTEPTWVRWVDLPE
jgi:hypothetical protein